MVLHENNCLVFYMIICNNPTWAELHCTALQ